MTISDIQVTIAKIARIVKNPDSDRQLADSPDYRRFRIARRHLLHRLPQPLQQGSAGLKGQFEPT